LLAGIPSCRREWVGSAGPVERLLQAFGKAPPAATPADEIVARLSALDGALLRFSSRANARVGEPLGIDGARWFAAVEQGPAAPVESVAYPEQRFALRCADLVGALAALARSDARMLEAWPGAAPRAARCWRTGAPTSRWRSAHAT
jgi:hypothetical protein